MKDYLEHRQYVIHELPKAEVNEKIELFVRLLGEAWLDEEVDHPVRNVWKRRDYLATNELVNLVYAIDAIYKLDSKWLKDQLKRVKSKDLTMLGELYLKLWVSVICLATGINSSLRKMGIQA